MPASTPQLTRAEMRRRTAPAVLDESTPDAATPAEPAPVDAEVAAQSAMVEQVAAAVVETVIAATIEPTLPPRRRSSRTPGQAPAAEQERPVDAGVEVLASDSSSPETDADALAVTVVDERTSDGGDVAVILQSAEPTTATTPVALPTSPITLPATRRVRRRPEAAVAPEAAETPAPEAPAKPEAATKAESASSAFGPAADGNAVADEFEAAARLFAFTGETPVQSAPKVAAPAEPVTVGLPAAAAPRTRRNGRRIAAASFSVGVMGLVGLMTVGMTMPVSALASASGTSSVTAADTQPATVSLAAGTPAAGDVDSTQGIQAYVAPAESQAAVVDRSDGYAASTYTQMAIDSGIKYPSNFYVNNPNSPIQWPFAVGVSISYGFGMRDGGFHEGADFVPGEGAPVQAIADGTVRIATEQGGAFGVTVLIDHEIDGELVSSRYGHMQYGSLQVTQGEHVHVGQVLGHTGNTGRSFGAHTHVEILQNGTTPIDPIPWLRQHAGG
ncbi:membrane proteins [Microbacterium testaceum StLB037]|uniref:Membrane proteins n=1 Tax=Microbacterium testaceum (strain StLB037) TaxID=979556 RepID=E8NGQ6_MICTS|nr:M23 family metallopeptidase [Microbacterium testaceum]BAJ75355.1 membrane proteins [Microbacterium testaceum StLB037]